MSARVDLKEFLSAYLAEADEQISLASSRLLSIEQHHARGERDPRGVRDLFRVLHTLKGLSSMVGVEPIVAIAHRMETVLRAADRAEGRLPENAPEQLVEGLRAIEQRVRALEAGRPVAAPPPALFAALDGLDAPLGPAQTHRATLDLPPDIAGKLAPFERDQLLAAAAADKRALRVDFAPSPERAAKGLTINSVRERLAAVADVVRVVPISRPAEDAAPAGLAFVLLLVTAAPNEEIAGAAGVEPSEVIALAPSAPEEDTTAIEAAPLEPLADDEVEEGPRRSVLRVDVARVDDAMERLSTLIVTRSRLNAAIAKLAAREVDTRELAHIAQENARQLRDLRAAILSVRMVPLLEVLERVPLVVRGLKRTSGKAVRVALDAAGAELDKAVAERLFPAIVHLVRNAVDHGLETPEERRRAGKAEEGLIEIVCAERSSARLELIVRDDGRGIDRDAVARRSGREAPTSDDALLDRICEPGFSTRDQTTTTSGRGMGMDIVRRIVVAELGGELTLRTEPGRGTTFVVRVPQTIAILDAFVIACAGERLCVPLRLVDELVDVDPDAMAPPPGRRARGALRGMIERRGAVVPVLDLATLLDLPREAGAPAPRKALVVRRGGEPIALLVDAIRGQQEAVVRPLVDPLVQVPGITGATDLGDGRPVLVVDLAALAWARDEGRAPAAPPALPPTSSRKELAS